MFICVFGVILCLHGYCTLLYYLGIVSNLGPPVLAKVGVGLDSVPEQLILVVPHRHHSLPVAIPAGDILADIKSIACKLKDEFLVLFLLESTRHN